LSDISASERIARAVADDLNNAASTFAVSFLAKYDPKPEYELSDLKTVRLNVVDTGQRSLGRGSRGCTDYEYQIQLITQVQVDTSLAQVLTRLKKLAEDISDFFMFESPTGCEETIDRVEVAELAQDDDLKTLGLARFSTTLIFFGHRDKRE